MNKVEKIKRKINVISLELQELKKLNRKVDQISQMVEKLCEVVLNQASGSGTY
jgi:hypothetical protein